MGYQEILTAAKRLSLDDQFKLVEELIRAMRATAAVATNRRLPAAQSLPQQPAAPKPEGRTPAEPENTDGSTTPKIEKYL